MEAGLAAVLWGVVVVSVAVVVAVAGLLATQRLLSLELREAHNDNTAAIFAALYVMYALVVGFAALLVMEQYDAARRTVEEEAASLENLYELAEGLPGPERREIQEDVEAYARVVVEEGWPLMEEGGLSPRAGELEDEIRRGVVDFEPGTSGEQALYSQTLTRVQELDEARSLRLLEAREGLPTILWVVLVFGGFVTIAFTSLFGMKTLRLHALMVAALTLVTVLVLYTIRALEYPFDGIVQIGPDAFEAVLRKIEGGRE